MNILKAIRKFLSSEDGTTAVEYAVMLAMILIAIIFGVSGAGGSAGGWWSNIRDKIAAT